MNGEFKSHNPAAPEWLTDASRDPSIGPGRFNSQKGKDTALLQVFSSGIVNSTTRSAAELVGRHVYTPGAQRDAADGRCGWRPSAFALKARLRRCSPIARAGLP
jgi:hypothetical protein